jgi:hypothetical protein
MAFNLWRTIRGSVIEERPIPIGAPAPALSAAAE